MSNCTWIGEKGALCACRWVISGDIPLISPRDGAGATWCAFHAPDYRIVLSAFDSSHLRDFLERLAKAQLCNGFLDLSGFRIPGDLVITGDCVLGATVEPNVLSSLKHINMTETRIVADLPFSQRGDIEIRLGKSSSAHLQISARGVSVAGKTAIVCNKLDEVLLDEGHFGSFLTLGSKEAPTEAQNVSARGAVFEGDLSLIDIVIRRGFDCSGASIKRSLRIESCRIESRSQKAHSVGQLLSDNPVRLDGPVSERQTILRQLVIDRTKVFGSLFVGLARIEGFVQLTDTEITGILNVEGRRLPEDSILSGLTVGSGLRAPIQKAQNNYDVSRIRRAFRQLRSISRDADQTAALLRQERAALKAATTVSVATRLLWWLHEFVTDAGVLWVFPVELLFSQCALFLTLLAAVKPDIPWSHAIALSIVNTVVPFLSLEGLADHNSITEVLLTAAQSVVAAGCLSTLLLSVRTRTE